jgi:hypothetical protein
MYGSTCTHNQEQGEEKSRDHVEAVAMDRYNTIVEWYRIMAEAKQKTARGVR